MMTPRDRYLLKRYGITEKIYRLLLKAQGGACGVCRRPPRPGKNLHVDHEHQKGGGGRVRGLLCFYCNKRRIGREKDPSVFEACIRYLRQDTGYMTPKTGKKKRKKRKNAR
jgi:hypothetical protein